MRLFGRGTNKSADAASPKRKVEIKIFASDDLVTRAENIVRACNWNPHYYPALVLNVHDCLREYARIDAESAQFPAPQKGGEGEAG